MKQHIIMLLLCAMSVACHGQQPMAIVSAQEDSATLAQASDTSACVQEATADSIQAKQSLITRVENWYADNMNYGSIVALMAIESSFIPFPSEVVIPPAAYVAGHEESSLNRTPSYVLNVLLIVLFGTLGAMLGAIINYLLALWLGRPIIYAFADSKVGHWMLLSSEKIKKAEDYFKEHGKGSTFFGRLIPAIRQLISIPAGLAKMHFGQFLLFTFLGAALWNSVLAFLGYLAHGQADLINRYSDELSWIILAVVAVVAIVLIIRHFVKKRKA